jgi:hypothetical protein
MERARCEVEEHPRVCFEFVRSIRPLQEQKVTPRVRDRWRHRRAQLAIFMPLGILYPDDGCALMRREWLPCPEHFQVSVLERLPLNGMHSRVQSKQAPTRR